MYSAGITASDNRTTCFKECHMNRKMNGQAGFTLIELIVVIVILGILAVTAAPKFMNLTSDANASVVKGLAGSVKSAYQMVYAKSRLHTTDSYVCASDECLSGDSITKDSAGVINVTNKGYPRSQLEVPNVSDFKLKNTIVGAVDLGVALSDMPDTINDGANITIGDWVVARNADGIAFIPSSAPNDAKTASHYTSTATDTAETSKSTCGVYYKALDGDTSTPTVKVFVKGC